MGQEVKKRRPGHTRLSGKNQVTIPVAVVRAAGLSPGDELAVEVDPTGAIRLVLVENWLDSFSGTLTGVYEGSYLDDLRAEWGDDPPSAGGEATR